MLKGTAASTDVSTEKNMQDLVEIGQELLNKPVSRVDLETGGYMPVPNLGTNADALKRSVLPWVILASLLCYCFPSSHLYLQLQNNI